MFRFTIRDLLWLTVVAAVTLGLGLGWRRDRASLAESRDTWMTTAQILRDYADSGPFSFTIHSDGNLTLGPD